MPPPNVRFFARFTLSSAFRYSVTFMVSLTEVAQYASAVRFVFGPVIVLSGFWMYSGVVFAVIGVAVWLGAYYLSGIGAAILSQVALFIARKIWLVIRARRSK